MPPEESHYEERVRYYTELELGAHPEYPSMIEMITNILKSYDVFESFNVEQTGGFTMVPTFYLKDGCSIGFTWDAAHWLMCIYDKDGECVRDFPSFPEKDALLIAEAARLVARGLRGSLTI